MSSVPSNNKKTILGQLQQVFPFLNPIYQFRVFRHRERVREHFVPLVPLASQFFCEHHPFFFLFFLRLLIFCHFVLYV
jgi:hypothetical protein